MGGAEPGLARWLADRDLSQDGFERLIKGLHEPRPHIPLQGQELAGRVVELLEDETGTTSGLKVLSRAGDVVRTDRSRLYVYGHWMGRSDLPVCLLHGEFHITYLICYCPIVLLP